MSEIKLTRQQHEICNLACFIAGAMFMAGTPQVDLHHFTVKKLSYLYPSIDLAVLGELALSIISSVDLYCQGLGGWAEGATIQ